MSDQSVDRSAARRLLDGHVTTSWLKKHSIAAAAVMEGLARHFGEDPDFWYVTGLLHDLDFDHTQDPEIHGDKTAKILGSEGYPEQMIHAIRAHNAEHLNVERQSRLDYALSAAETITGLIVATALVMPDKKLASVKESSVRKRMKKKDFARNVNRDRIAECEQAGLDLETFISIALASMKDTADQLEL
ncbi:MAG: HDIG domain-containing protein [Spirochaetales bacterium]|nr:HDIG domain-containing protein [Spirochaetales bacterium]MCF7937923.1 HDIG domain-containing protein [Spirochaetales bacterium]